MSPERTALTVLFVCTGNICRSPLAEYRLRAALADRASSAPLLDVRVLSRGVRAPVDAPIHPLTDRVARRAGIDASAHRSTRLSAADVRDADFILTMEKMQRADVVRLDESGIPKTLVLGAIPAILGRERTRLLEQNATPIARIEALVRAQGGIPVVERRTLDLVDPIGRSARTHRVVGHRIMDAVDALADYLAAPVGSSGRSDDHEMVGEQAGLTEQ